jgi:hypothetical protein
MGGTTRKEPVAPGKLSAVTVVETILVFAGAPLAIIAVLALLTLRPEKGQKRLRYKPGQPWDYPPVWYEPHPDHGPAAGHGRADGHEAITAAPRPHPGGPLGGARGTW